MIDIDNAEEEIANSAAYGGIHKLCTLFSSCILKQGKLLYL
jgi:hypothetical protein